MLKRIGELLDALNMELQAAWAHYLQDMDQDALWNLEHARGELGEALRVFDAIFDLRSRVCSMRNVVDNSSCLNPLRKEN